METIKDFLVKKLRDAGQRRWPAIAAEINSELPDGKLVGVALLRKIAYGDRDNPGVMTIQPIYDYFKQVESGARKLPELATTNPTTEPAAAGV